MNNSIITFVKKQRVEVVILDIDGTLKDLCAEHTNAVKATLKHFKVSKARKNVVSALNKAAMYIVKTGIIPTNHSNQNLLVKIYAIICGVKVVNFYETYFENYTREVCLFDGVYDLLKQLNVESQVYFATINKQNYNLEECGIPQGRIMYTDGTFKVATYNKLIKSIGVDKSKVVIVGDNLFDDLCSANQLGVRCLLVNRYNNIFKSVVCKIVKSRYLK